MHDLYQAPALILTVLLLPAFGHLYYRTRDIRNLLWFLAFVLVAARSVLLYSAGEWILTSEYTSWSAATGESFALIGAALFLGSLSPLSFRIGRFRILYVIPFIVPLVVYALLAYGVYGPQRPSGVMTWAFPAFGFCSVVAGLLWGLAKGCLPAWLGVAIGMVFGGCAAWFYFSGNIRWPLFLAESGIYLIAALLVIAVFRRLSPGVAIACLGFVMGSLPILLLSPRFHDPTILLLTLRLIVTAKVVAALGLILLALENELAMNKAARRREERARRELEAYTSLELPRRRIDDFDRHADQICHLVAANSRFSQAALLLLHETGIYRLAGTAGLDGATIKALESLTARLPTAKFLRPGSAPPAVENSQTLHVDLRPWMRPGDDLERLQFTSAFAVPLHGRTVVEGALLLAGMRNDRGGEPLRRDDLAAVEMLVGRMQAVRSQARMLEKLLDSEKFAGIGQLAGNVTMQLNNPLTVILGYAAMLEEAPGIHGPERKGVDAILNAARTMRSTLESLQRVARSPGGQLTAVSVCELLNDMKQLHRPEFFRRSIELEVNVASNLPRVMCQPQQLRQAILHCLQFAMKALEAVQEGNKRTVTIDAAAAGENVRIAIAHNGPGFEHPEQAFDPLVPAQAAAGETLGLGLSVCATILRENNGHATAMNLEPTGAAIVLELEAA